MTESLVKDFYTMQVRKEWRRLVKDRYHRLELETTLHSLLKYLPEQGLLLDAGGGPGRYTIEMAQRGYDLVLLDFTPANLVFARRQIKKTGCQEKVKEIVEGSIVNLARFADHTFDAVLCLGGPLSHILEKSEREKAVTELARVVKPGGFIFASVMSLLSVVIMEMALFQPEIDLPHFKPMRDTGDYFGGSGFTACHFFLADELRDLFCVHSLELVEMVGLEGISSRHRKKLNELSKNEGRWATWMETHYLTCTDPAVVAMSEHMLIICRKRTE